MKKIWMKGEVFTALNAEEIKSLNDEQIVAYHDDATKSKEIEAEKINNTIIDLQENATTNKSEIETLKTQLAEVMKAHDNSLIETVKTQGIVLAKLMKNGSSSKVETIKDILSANGVAIKNVKNKGVNFTVKASQVPGDIGDRTDLAARIPGVEQIARRKVFMKDLIKTVSTDTEYIKKTEQDVVVRDAKNVAACAPSTHNTKLTWKQTTLQQRKVRDFVHVCIDMMEDYDFVEGEIKDLIEYGVASHVDAGLLLGDGISPNINGVASYASTFNAALVGADYSAATGSPIQTPNVGDLICVAGAQIEFLGQHNNFMPNVAVVNPKTVKLLKLTKDKNDQYLIPNWLTANGDEVGEIMLISNPLVPENEAYVMDSTKATIYQAKALNVAMSFENNDNFETETVTVKGYERLNLWVSTNNSNAFMHIPSISAAITAITKP